MSVATHTCRNLFRRIGLSVIASQIAVTLLYGSEILLFSSTSCTAQTSADTKIAPLIEKLKLEGEKNKQIRRGAADAITKIGLPAIRPLVPMLRGNRNGRVRWYIGESLENIAGELQDKAKILSDSQLQQAISDLEEALRALEYNKTKFPHDSFIDKNIARVRRPLSALKAEKEIRSISLRKTFESIFKNQWLLGTAIYLVFFPSLWFLIIRFRPLWLLRINDFLKPYEFKLPETWGGAPVRIRDLLFFSLFSHRHKVLDAWVTKYLTTAYQQFQQKNTVGERAIHIPVLAILNEKKINFLTGNSLQSTFNKNRGCLLICGEGGTGKTSLACQIAKWGIEGSLCEHKMLPVLIEEELNFKLETGKQPLLEAISGQLQDLIDEATPISEELLKHLLQQRRILVIIDHFSEMSEATQQEIKPQSPDFLVNSLVITSRRREDIKVTHSILKPCGIESSGLVKFMEDYLEKREKRIFFTNPELLDGCSHLSRLVDKREITLLLAKLYAEQMIVAYEDGKRDTLPESIPNLILDYINRLNASVTEEQFDDATVQQDTKILGWESLKATYRPADVKIKDVMQKLGGDNAKTRLKYLEERLHLIRTIPPAKTEIRFSLDPLAEYLAAFRLLDIYGTDENHWINFLTDVEDKTKNRQEIKGFLIAVRDCHQAKINHTHISNFVADELSRIIQLVP
ncbi:PBS lyase [Brasilonema sp. UFV-L1]|nr:PBS lyase [Brasilonema sp. UFV-L1]